MNDRVLVASTPAEMSTLQHSLIQEMQTKIDAAMVEAQAAHDMKEQMLAARLSPAKAKIVHRRATARVGFLTKCHAALQAGYFMMPDMPGDVVAVRLGREMPLPANRRWRSHWRGIPDETGQGLPVGVGEYRSPRQSIETRRVPTGKMLSDGKTPEQAPEHRAIELRDPDGLHKRFVKPAVMARTAAAMATKVFDEIVAVGGTAVARRKDRDPIVLGRIVDPVNNRVAAFLIVSFVNTAEL